MGKDRQKTVGVDIRGVRRWLQSLEPEEVCGERRDAESCPLARYLNAANQSFGSHVVSDHYNVKEVVERPLRPWARRFVELVDKEHTCEVSAGRALCSYWNAPRRRRQDEHR